MWQGVELVGLEQGEVLRVGGGVEGGVGLIVLEVAVFGRGGDDGMAQGGIGDGVLVATVGNEKCFGGDACAVGHLVVGYNPLAFAQQVLLYLSDEPALQLLLGVEMLAVFKGLAFGTGFPIVLGTVASTHMEVFAWEEFHDFIDDVEEEIEGLLVAGTEYGIWRPAGAEGNLLRLAGARKLWFGGQDGTAVTG